MKVSTPMTRDIGNLKDDEKPREEGDTTEHEYDSDLDDAQESRAMQRAHRAAAEKCNYIGTGRPDIQYARTEAARRMSSPARRDNQCIERMAKYINNAAGMMVQLFRGEGEDHRAITVGTMRSGRSAKRRFEARTEVR